MPTIAITRPLHGPFELPDVPGAEIRVGPRAGHASRREFLDFMAGADAVVTWFTDAVDDAFLDAVGPQLRVVAHDAVGYDNIDVVACSRRGVVVTNTPDAVTEATADVAALLLLAAARRLPHADRFARSGAWERHGPLAPDEMLAQPIGGQNLVIVGAGRIGYATAMRLVGWGFRTSYVARGPKPRFEEPPLSAERVDLASGLARADFVSVHTPLTSETRGLIGAAELALMKPTAVLVNTSRGPVVDESALADALESERIYAAGLDVFEAEPRINERLRALDNVVFTPHFGSADTRCRARMTALCAANINRVLSGQPPLTPVG